MNLQRSVMLSIQALSRRRGTMSSRSAVRLRNSPAFKNMIDDSEKWSLTEVKKTDDFKLTPATAGGTACRNARFRSAVWAAQHLRRRLAGFRAGIHKNHRISVEKNP